MIIDKYHCLFRIKEIWLLQDDMRLVDESSSHADAGESVDPIKNIIQDEKSQQVVSFFNLSMNYIWHWIVTRNRRKTRDWNERQWGRHEFNVNFTNLMS